MRWRVGLLLAFASSLASLVMLEAAGRLVVREPLGLFRPSARLGYDMAPDYSGRHRKLFDFDVSIRTDARGLRATDERAAVTGRVALFLGDSVTFGWGVEAEQAWPAQVMRLSAAHGASGLAAVNAGVWGYNTLQELAFLRAVDEGSRPSVVVVELTSPVTPTRNWYCRERGAITLEPLLPETNGSLAPLHALLKRHSHVYSFLERRIRYRGSLFGFGRPAAMTPDTELPVDDAAALSTDLLRQLRDEARRLGAEFAVVVFPTLDQLVEASARPPPAPSTARALRERLMQRLRESEIAALDLTESLAAYQGREELFLPRDNVHPNRAGHARSAEAARIFLAETWPGLF